MLKSKIKLARRELKKVSAFSPQPSAFVCSAFTLVEILVVVVLMSLIVLALMAVFSSTQAAFRASITQTDVLEGGRSVMGLIKSDLEPMTPSFGVSNINVGSLGAVNFYVAVTNYASPPSPLFQSLAGSSQQRTNLLENFFILSRQNVSWYGTGYAVATNSSSGGIYSLYRFATNYPLAVNPVYIFTNNFRKFLLAPTNGSHLLDGVVDLRMHAYDPNGYWMTIGYTNIARNVWFFTPVLGEVGFSMFSNTLPASVEIQLGLLEDRTLQRAQSISGLTQSNYLAGRAGQVHLFRQRFPIRNVDPSAYQ